MPAPVVKQKGEHEYRMCQKSGSSIELFFLFQYKTLQDQTEGAKPAQIIETLINFMHNNYKSVGAPYGAAEVLGKKTLVNK